MSVLECIKSLKIMTLSHEVIKVTGNKSTVMAILQMIKYRSENS